MLSARERALESALTDMVRLVGVCEEFQPPLNPLVEDECAICGCCRSQHDALHTALCAAQSLLSGPAGPPTRRDDA